MKKYWKIILAFCLAVIAAAAVYFLYVSHLASAKPQTVTYTNGKQVLCNHVIILAKASAKQSDVEAYAKAINASIIGAIPEYNAYTFFVPGKCDLKTVQDGINYFKSKPGIQDAGPENF